MANGKRPLFNLLNGVYLDLCTLGPLEDPIFLPSPFASRRSPEYSPKHGWAIIADFVLESEISTQI